MTLDEVNKRIAYLEQKIAEKKAMDARYNRPASTFDYIISGDRSGLDRIAQQNMTEELAKKQQINTALDKMDELMKLRNKAVINVNYAEQALKSAKDKGVQTDIDAAERDLQLAKEDLAYYNNRTGYTKSPTKGSSPEDKSKEGQETQAPSSSETTVETESQETPSKEPPVKLEVTIEDLNAITSKNSLSEMEEALKKAISHPMRGQDEKLEAAINNLNKLIANKKDWLADEEFMKNWKDGQPFNKNKFRRVISKGVWTLERKK